MRKPSHALRSVAKATLLALLLGSTGAALADKAALEAAKAAKNRASGEVPERAECPANTDVNRDGGILRCSVTLVFERGSICPPINKANYTVFQMTGSDKCLPQVTGDVASVPSAMNPVAAPGKLKGQSGPPGDFVPLLIMGPSVLQAPPDERFSRVVDATGADKFVAEKVVHFWPVNYPVHYVAGKNSANGVRCPAGYTTVTGSSPNSLGCEMRETRKPMCQNIGGVGWRLDTKRGEDRCQGPTEGPTKPDGEHVGPGDDWSLEIDASGNQDRWVRIRYTKPEGR